MTTHTPGPWKSNAYRVCAGVGTPAIKVICDTANNMASRTPENEANARLIAAAPDLLAHLKHMVWLVETELKEDGGHILQGAKDAIEKATE